MMRTCLALATLAMVAACSINPRNYETEPVTVETAEGAVTCQLYTKRMLDWDRAISRPATMSVEAADEVCREEGRRQQAEG